MASVWPPVAIEQLENAINDRHQYIEKQWELADAAFQAGRLEEVDGDQEEDWSSSSASTPTSPTSFRRHRCGRARTRNPRQPCGPNPEPGCRRCVQAGCTQRATREPPPQIPPARAPPGPTPSRRPRIRSLIGSRAERQFHAESLEITQHFASEFRSLELNPG